MNRIRMIAALALMLLALAGVAGQKSNVGQKQKEPPPDYFPLRVGDWWKYQISGMADGKTSEYTMKVLAEEKQPDGTAQYQVEIMSTMASHIWYSKPSGWVLRHREAYPHNETMKVTFEPVRQYLKNPPTAGATWQWKGKGMMGVEIDESNTVIGPEMVEVPAGKFQAMKVETNLIQGGSPVKLTYWYANWIGFVKGVTESGTFKSTSVLLDYSFKKK
jgi:hypothetical protein